MHTLDPSILPLSEAPAEGFFWNLSEFGRRIRFNVLHACETRPLTYLLTPWSRVLLEKLTSELFS
jgi:hypothetical protein